MAHFRATIQGNRGGTSRLGTAASGIHATINGWNVGVTIQAMELNGHDVIVVWKTKGSGSHGEQLIATIEEEPS